MSDSKRFSVEVTYSDDGSVNAELFRVREDEHGEQFSSFIDEFTFNSMLGDPSRSIMRRVAEVLSEEKDKEDTI